jgi:hypothetical protein
VVRSQEGTERPTRTPGRLEGRTSPREEEKRRLVVNTPPYQIRARTAGEPALGLGAIYPIDEAEVIVPDRDIPDSWPLAFGMDVGWNRTAVVWSARDPGSGMIYLYKRTLSRARRARVTRPGDSRTGRVDTGGIDPACLGSSQIDGRTLMQLYGKLDRAASSSYPTTPVVVKHRLE